MKREYQIRYAAGLHWISVLHQKGPDYIRPLPVNEGGAYIWEKLRGGASEEEIISSFREKYAIEEAIAERDVKSFIAQLKNNHFLDEEN